MKAGLKKSALANAQMLMLPEHRSLINPNWKRKIETMVRRRFRLTPLRNSLFTPELQWQARGKTAYLTGVCAN